MLIVKNETLSLNSFPKKGSFTATQRILDQELDKNKDFQSISPRVQ